MTHEEQLREMGEFSPKRIKLQDDLIVVHCYLVGAHRKDGASLEIHSGRTKQTHKLLHRKFRFC